MASVWGGDSPSVAWGDNSWQSTNFPLDITAPSTLTSSTGSITAYPESGWGGDTWGMENWGENAVDIIPTGLSLTSSVGEILAQANKGFGYQAWGSNEWGELNDNTASLTGVSATASVGELQAYSLAGWGRAEWGEEPWGESNSPTITLTGVSATVSLGDLTYAGATDGWGRNAWGDNDWGENTSTFTLTAPDGLTASLPAVGWGDQAWSADAWGGEYFLDPADVVGLSGLSVTASVPTQLDIPEQISGVSATTSIGQLSLNDGADHVQGLASLVATSATGAIAPADVIGISGLGATISIGSITVASVELVDVTGVGATASVGAISPTEMTIGLSGVSATASTGAISPTEMTIGLTGVSATVSVGQVGGPIAWKKVTPTQGGSWSKRTPS